MHHEWTDQAPADRLIVLVCLPSWTQICPQQNRYVFRIWICLSCLQIFCHRYYYRNALFTSKSLHLTLLPTKETFYSKLSITMPYAHWSSHISTPAEAAGLLGNWEALKLLTEPPVKRGCCFTGCRTDQCMVALPSEWKYMDPEARPCLSLSRLHTITVFYNFTPLSLQHCVWWKLRICPGHFILGLLRKKWVNSSMINFDNQRNISCCQESKRFIEFLLILSCSITQSNGRVWSLNKGGTSKNSNPLIFIKWN